MANVLAFNLYVWSSPVDRDNKTLSAVVVLLFLGYFLGWWPMFREVTGRWPPTPNWTIEMKHRAAAAAILIGIVAANPTALEVLLTASGAL